MTDLVTLEQAKKRLRVFGNDRDADIQLMIEGASVLILRHLAGGDDFMRIEPVVVPKDVQNATLTLVGVMLRDPDGANGKDWDRGFLPRAVSSLLVSRRKPVLA